MEVSYFVTSWCWSQFHDCKSLPIYNSHKCAGKDWSPFLNCCFYYSFGLVSKMRFIGQTWKLFKPEKNFAVSIFSLQYRKDTSCVMNNLSRKQRKLADNTLCQLLSWTIIILIKALLRVCWQPLSFFSCHEIMIYDQITVTQCRFLLMRVRWISCLVLGAAGGVVRRNPTCEDTLNASWCCCPCREGAALWLWDAAVQGPLWKRWKEGQHT